MDRVLQLAGTVGNRALGTSARRHRNGDRVTNCLRVAEGCAAALADTPGRGPELSRPNGPPVDQILRTAAGVQRAKVVSPGLIGRHHFWKAEHYDAGTGAFHTLKKRGEAPGAGADVNVGDIRWEWAIQDGDFFARVFNWAAAKAPTRAQVAPASSYTRVPDATWLFLKLRALDILTTGNEMPERHQLGVVDGRTVYLNNPATEGEGAVEERAEEQGDASESFELEFMGYTTELRRSRATLNFPKISHEFSEELTLLSLQTLLTPGILLDLSLSGHVEGSLAAAGKAATGQDPNVLEITAKACPVVGARVQAAVGTGVPYVASATAGVFGELKASVEARGDAQIERHSRQLKPGLQLEAERSLNFEAGLEAGVKTIFWGDKLALKKTLVSREFAPKKWEWNIDDPRREPWTQLGDEILGEGKEGLTADWDGLKEQPYTPDEFQRDLDEEQQKRLLQIRGIKTAWGEDTPEERQRLEEHKAKAEAAYLAGYVKNTDGPSWVLEELESPEVP